MQLPGQRGLLLLLIAVITVLGGIVLASGALSGPHQTLKDWQSSATKDELKDAFTEVARNLGALEAAYYTYSLEFRAIPASVEAMIESGHLRTPLLSPYTGEPVRFPGGESLQAQVREGEAQAGDIWFRPDVEGGEIAIAGLFLDPNNTQSTRWMRRDIVRFFNPAVHQYLFANPADFCREDKLVRIAMEQMLTAIEEHEIRFGRFPDSFEELARGDTKVDYWNPYAPDRFMRPSETHSPGDFLYRSLGPEDYLLVGWGAAGPVWFVSENMFNWSVSLDPATNALVVTEPSQETLAAIQAAGALDFTPPSDGVLNRYVYIEWIQEHLDADRLAAWLDRHPDCPDCGSTYVFWTVAPDGNVVCADERSHHIVPDCCCQELERQEAGMY